MAPRKTTPPAGAETPADPWAELAPAVAMPTKQGFTGISIDVLAKVPEPIRQRAESSLTVNAARVAAKAGSTAKRVHVNYHWDLQPVSTRQLGEEFAKLLTKYAKYRPADKPIPH